MCIGHKSLRPWMIIFFPFFPFAWQLDRVLWAGKHFLWGCRNSVTLCRGVFHVVAVFHGQLLLFFLIIHRISQATKASLSNYFSFVHFYFCKGVYHNFSWEGGFKLERKWICVTDSSLSLYRKNNVHFLLLDHISNGNNNIIMKVPIGKNKNVFMNISCYFTILVMIII